MRFSWLAPSRRRRGGLRQPGEVREQQLEAEGEDAVEGALPQMRRDRGDVRQRNIVAKIVERRAPLRIVGRCPRGDVGEAGAVGEIADRPEDAGRRGGIESGPAKVS